ncbi:MAG: hypothetical protein HKP41_04370 [Desulfobacterales bacterium]|nr:hypothetical protein [Desulfobacterales bacterium]
MKKEHPQHQAFEQKAAGLVELKLLIPEDLFRAWQRCSWLIACEKEKNRTDIMEEMVREFLTKHGC